MKINQLPLYNIQIYQTLILALILGVGIYFYHLDITLYQVSIIFLTVIILDFLLKNREIIKQKKIFKQSSQLQFPYSGINAGFGIAFFLRTDDSILYFIAGVIAILSKYFIKSNGRHFLNPSNAGVFLVLILFPQYAWVDTLQWGNYSGIIDIKYFSIFISILILGCLISLLVYRSFKFQYLIDYILPFLALHFILFFIIPFHEDINSFFLFFNASFMIFTFFMITDPKTVPERSINRSLYAIGLVLSFYVLNFIINENYALLGSLFVSTFLLPYIWSKEKQVKSGNKFKSVLILRWWLLLLIILIILGIFYFGQPDLSFGNTCNQVFCK